MKIGYDAKRAFHNGTGLGHYSRTLLRSLSEIYPHHAYYLFNPKRSNAYQPGGKDLQEINPVSPLHRLFPAAWRSSWVIKDLKRLKIDLYHGLSHEIPLGIHKTGIRSVVTIHDLIHERYPEQYNPVDTRIYDKKFRYACNYADRVIAISEQTKKDIIEFYGTPAEKIHVCYQSCNPGFANVISEEEKMQIRKRYGLPPEFFLYVGSVIERKNLLAICEALTLLRNDIDLPLVVIGDGKKYKQQVKDYLNQNGMERNVIFLSESIAARNSETFRNATDFPAIYQCAIAMIYPSYFEGFGLPVLEALWSRIPVITSNMSCLPETGGDAALYVDPALVEEIAAGMKKVYSEREFVKIMVEKGWDHAQRFTREKCAARVMKVYESL